MIPFSELECPRCGRRGTLDVVESAPTMGMLECRACGAQVGGDRADPGDIFGGL